MRPIFKTKMLIYHSKANLYVKILFGKITHHRLNRPRFVYTHFKSWDHFLDEASFDFSNIFRAMQSFVISTKSSIILKLPKSMVT